MGYRLILRRFEYPRTVRAGQMMQIHMWWLNAGVAPVYRVPTALETFCGGSGSQRSADVRKWLPGDAVDADRTSLPS
jgi:hypothetical protein